jgi:hypothetical protein
MAHHLCWGCSKHPSDIPCRPLQRFRICGVSVVMRTAHQQLLLCPGTVRIIGLLRAAVRCRQVPYTTPELALRTALPRSAIRGRSYPQMNLRRIRGVSALIVYRDLHLGSTRSRIKRGQTQALDQRRQHGLPFAQEAELPQFLRILLISAEWAGRLLANSVVHTEVSRAQNNPPELGKIRQEPPTAGNQTARGNDGAGERLRVRELALNAIRRTYWDICGVIGVRGHGLGQRGCSPSRCNSLRPIRRSGHLEASAVPGHCERGGPRALLASGRGLPSWSHGYP